MPAINLNTEIISNILFQMALLALLIELTLFIASIMVRANSSLLTAKSTIILRPLLYAWVLVILVNRI
jgi:hypothetical protein